MKPKQLEKFVKPLYKKKDSMHNFKHILKIKRKIPYLKKDYKKINNDKLNFLTYFHGLKKFVNKNRKEILELGYNREYIKTLNRHIKNPKTVEEKIVSDANSLESVGKFGIKKAFAVGKKQKRTKKETIIFIKRNIKKIKFYTKKGKTLGNKGIKVIERYLNKF